MSRLLARSRIVDRPKRGKTRRDIVPAALSLNLKHNGVLHDTLVLLKVTTERIPRVDESDRVTAEPISPAIRWVELHFGFAEKPDVPAALRGYFSADALSASTGMSSR